jgi:hypothetical protein
VVTFSPPSIVDPVAGRHQPFLRAKGQREGARARPAPSTATKTAAAPVSFGEEPTDVAEGSRRSRDKRDLLQRGSGRVEQRR